MKTHDAAFAIANTMSDINANALALIEAIKQISSDENFRNHAMGAPIINYAKRLESILMREVI